MLNRISDEFLIDTYIKALRNRVDPSFIDLLEDEIINRIITFKLDRSSYYFLKMVNQIPSNPKNLHQIKRLDFLMKCEELQRLRDNLIQK